MARRRASKKKKSMPMAAIIGGSVALVAIVLGVILFKGEPKKTMSADVPWDVLINSPSQLENNQYKLEGVVGDRFPRGKSELIAFVCKDPSGRTLSIPIIVRPEVKEGININRDQSYVIDIQVENLSNNVKGLCVATKILPK